MSHRKPTVLKLIQGNPGRRPLNKDEPKPEPAIPSCPRHLNPMAKLEWRRVSKLLHEVGLLSEIDRAALAMYCQCWGRWVEAERELEKSGPLVKTRNSNYPIVNPYLSIANKAMRQMASILAEFGMTPASRSRIKAGVPSTERDPFQELLDGA
jgi:P27 family predicted phage terminase small subunit